MALVINPCGPDILGSAHAVSNVGARLDGSQEFTGSLSIKTVLSGSGIWSTADRRFVVSESTYLVLNHGRRYSVDNTSARAFCVYFHPGFVERTVADLSVGIEKVLNPTIPVESSFHERLSPYGDLVTMGLDKLKRYLSAGLRDSWLEGEIFTDLSEALVLEHRVAKAQERRIAAARPATREEIYRRLNLARDLMLSASADPITLQHAAGSAFLSPYHFQRLFTQAFGVTPHGFLTQIRVARASVLLRKTDLPVREICRKVGFESVGTFCSFYKRRTGQTPTQHRQAISQE